MKLNKLFGFFVIFSLLGMSGCMSFMGTLDQHDQVKGSKVFIGTRNASDMLFAQNGSPLLLLDLPFEIVADTVFLPYTIFSIPRGHQENNKADNERPQKQTFQ